jgi:hypothetical protein
LIIDMVASSHPAEQAVDLVFRLAHEPRIHLRGGAAVR